MCRWWSAVAIVATATTMGCSRSAPEYSATATAEPMMDEAEMAEEAPAAPPPMSRAVAMPEGAAGGAPGAAFGARQEAKKMRVETELDADDMPADDVPADGEGGEAPDAQPAQKPKPKKRMVHYNGYCKLRVTRPEDVLAKAVAIAEKVEGYVESYSPTAVTLRIPVASFQKVYDQVLKLGEVVARSITAQDVTDAFTAIELRLKTLRASRDRLIALLAKARSEQEKLTLLREIRRLTETVDQLALQLDTIASLASFSRITIEAEPRHTDPGRSAEELVGAFRWIREMSPFRRDTAELEDELELKAPEGMVALDSDDLWSAESPDGAVIWSHRRENRPEGDTTYWIMAIRDRLATDFAEATIKEVGGYSVLRLVDGGPSEYRYLIAVSARGEDLDIIEVYFPTPEHEERYGAAVETVIAGGGKA